ncbi:MAG: class I SAM-dependent methyltransferase [Candidatus Cloacimonetes bacterium]|nr:class I SAM-dependent methyltransferase [Candidatus Cloacimonadota bacterium]
MRIPFQGARLRPIIVGTMKYSPFITKMLPIAAGGTASARYCYAVWMRHLLLLTKFNGGEMPAQVAEIGPGDSLGVGLSALLSGAQSYFALEAIEYWNSERNLKIFDELIALFQKKEAIPGNGEFPLLKPVLDDHSFPHSIITDELLKESLNPERLEMIRKELQNTANPQNEFIQYKVPWHGEDVIIPHAIDFIFSHVALQHINEIEEAVVTMDHWLKPGGYVSHIIDYRSLGNTKKWNGHWEVPDWEWKIMVGGRKFSVNRKPHSFYVELFERNHLKLLYILKYTHPTHLSRNQLAQKFRSFSDDDLTTSGGYFVGQKSQ